MNTAQDRANRIAAVTVRSRDLFWIFSITAVMHFVVFGIIAFGGNAANLPITIFIIFGTIISIMGSLDCLDDIKAIGMDRGEDEVNTHFQKIKKLLFFRNKLSETFRQCSMGSI